MSSVDPLGQFAGLRLEIDPETRRRDLAAIGSELRGRPAAPRRRRWVLGVVVAALVLGPIGGAASDDAAPGDALYPIKLLIEPVLRLFDPDTIAEHRVEEVATLVDRAVDDSFIEERIVVARDALAQTDAPALEQELDRIVMRWSSGAPQPADGSSSSPVTRQPAADGQSGSADRRATTTTAGTAVRDPVAPPPVDVAPSTTEAPPRDSGRPPSDDRPRDGP